MMRWSGLNMKGSGWLTMAKAARPFALKIAAAALFVAASLLSAAAARGPESVADVAEGLQDTVVNISTTQTLKGSKEGTSIGPGPKGSPFEEFFNDFFDDPDSEGVPRKVSSLRSEEHT